WASSSVMVEMQERFSDLAEELVRQYLDTGQLSSQDLEPLQEVIGDIVERGDAFAEILNALGITAERADRAISEMTSSILGAPIGFRPEVHRFLAAGAQIPAMAEGGVVTRPTLALIGEAGPELVTPLHRAHQVMGGSTTVRIGQITINGADMTAQQQWARAMRRVQSRAQANSGTIARTGPTLVTR